MAVRELRNLARAESLTRALLRVRAWHARPLVQAPLSIETCQEMALLAVGRISRIARCARGAVHRRTGAATRARVILALSGQRTGGGLRHACTAGRRRADSRELSGGQS